MPNCRRERSTAPPSRVPHVGHVELSFCDGVCVLVNRLTSESTPCGGQGTQLGFDIEGQGFVSTEADDGAVWVDSLLTIDVATCDGAVQFTAGDGNVSPPPRGHFACAPRYVPLRLVDQRAVVKVFHAKWFVVGAQLLWQVRDFQGPWAVVDWSKSNRGGTCRWILDSWRYWEALFKKAFPLQPMGFKASVEGDRHDWQRPFDEAVVSSPALILLCLWRASKGRPRETRPAAMLVLRSVIDALLGGATIVLSMDLEGDEVGEMCWLAVTAGPELGSRLEVRDCKVDLRRFVAEASSGMRGRLCVALREHLSTEESEMLHIADLLFALYSDLRCTAVWRQIVAALSQTMTEAFHRKGFTQNPLDLADGSDFSGVMAGRRADMELWRRLSLGEGLTGDMEVHCSAEENARGFFRFRSRRGTLLRNVQSQVRWTQCRFLNAYLDEAKFIMAASTHISICTDGTRVGGRDVLAILFCCEFQGRCVCFWAPPQVSLGVRLIWPSPPGQRAARGAMDDRPCLY